MMTTDPCGNDGMPPLAICAFRIVGEFVDDWKKNPRFWLQEIDVQVDLASRLKRVAKKLGEGIMEASHTHWPNCTGKYSRVTCEPYVSTETGPSHPDVVIWDENAIGGDIGINSGKWPILWVCEIKYKSTRKEMESSRDAERIMDLCRNNLARYGCILELMDKDRFGDSELGWSKVEEAEKNIWRYRYDTRDYDCPEVLGGRGQGGGVLRACAPACPQNI